MGLRISKRFSLGGGKHVTVSKTGVSVGRRGRRGSVSANTRGGAGGSVRLLRGVSWMFGQRR